MSVMKASIRIRQAMASVVNLRQQASAQPELAQAVLAIKLLQAQRFAGTYNDLLASSVYGASAEFFLQELYGARDFSQRDQQFAHVAGALELTLPRSAVQTALTLAELHCLTETLDLAMAHCWQGVPKSATPEQRYVDCWKSLGHASDRQWQLSTVLAIGSTLGELTRKRSLRVTLKMMRKPAALAGLDALQTFLETGFDRFASMVQNGGAVQVFLDTIQERETQWIGQLFDLDAAQCSNQLGATLALAAQGKSA